MANLAPGTVRPAPWSWFTRGGWYFVVVMASFGLLSPIPFAHAAARLRNPAHWVSPVVYLVLIVTAIGVTRPGSNVGSTLALGVVLLAVVHLIWLRRQVWPVAAAPALPAGTDPALAAVLSARARRADARRIVADDPLAARELRIGRPDLRRDFDDGGLVDLNSAPAAAIAQVCGLDPALAERIVTARAGTMFAQVDDVFAFADIPVELWDRIRDRAVTVRA